MRRFDVRKATVALAALALAGSGALVACGDDDDDGGDLAAYCELSAELDEQETFPSDEQLDEIADLAPAEIADEADLAAERLQEDGEEAFDDPEVEEAFISIEEFEGENCDGEQDSDVS